MLASRLDGSIYVVVRAEFNSSYPLLELAFRETFARGKCSSLCAVIVSRRCGAQKTHEGIRASLATQTRGRKGENNVQGWRIATR